MLTNAALRTLLFVLPLAACAATSEDSAPPTPEASFKMEAVGVVNEWFDAVEARDSAGAAALGTKAWRQAEQANSSSFTNSIFRDGVRFETHGIVGTTIEDGLAKVRARATMLRTDGTTDNEGLRFSLERNAEGDVKIVDLD